ncbi:MAG: inosine/xanthosine triphosphatase [Parashewanella sp.]
MNKNTLIIVIGSKNPVKINSVKTAIEAYFPDHLVDAKGVHAPSLVAEQPMTAAETRQGAINRVQFCQDNHQADFYVAIEGGIDSTEDGVFTFAYIAISHNNHLHVGRSASLPLPSIVYNKLKQGIELGDVMDELFNTSNIKQKGGAIGLLTNQLASRGSCYKEALILVLAPIIHKELYEQ